MKLGSIIFVKWCFQEESSLRLSVMSRVLYLRAVEAKDEILDLIKKF